jgi:enterochelin esterase-like enzyme
MPELRHWLRQLHPPVVTVTLIAAVVSTAVRFGVTTHGLPLAVAYRSGYSGRALLAGRLSTVLSSQFLTRDGFMLISIVASLAIMLGGYELLAGSGRAAIVAIAGAVLGPVVVSLALSVGSALSVGFAARALSTLDYGASAITAAGGGAFVAFLGRRWLKWAALIFVIGGLFLHHQLADWEHLIAFPTGFALARFPRWPLLRRYVRPVRWRFRVASAARQLVGLLAVVGGAVLGPLGASTAVAGQVTHAAAAGVSGAVPQGPASPAGPPATRPLSPLQVIDTHYPTPSMGGTRRVIVVLPAGYNDTTTRYPVIEILHGSPGQPDDVLTGLDLTQLMAASPPFIALAPDGHGPVVGEGDFADTNRQRLGAAVSDDLHRWVDSTYRSDGYWGVTGLSAGGYGAAYLASRPEGGYQSVCPMSGYFTARDPAFKGQPAAVRAAGSPLFHVARNGPATMVIVGDLDSDGMTEARAYVRAMQEAGQPNELVVLHGGHEWSVWQSGLGRCIPFLLAGDH